MVPHIEFFKSLQKTVKYSLTWKNIHTHTHAQCVIQIHASNFMIIKVVADHWLASCVHSARIKKVKTNALRTEFVLQNVFLTTTKGKNCKEKLMFFVLILRLLISFFSKMITNYCQDFQGLTDAFHSSKFFYPRMKFPFTSRLLPF